MSYPEHILMDTIGCETSLCGTHDRLAEFITIGRHITCCVESFYTCLLTLVDDETSFSILIRIHRIDDPSEWCRSYGDEYSVDGEDLFRSIGTLDCFILRNDRNSSRAHRDSHPCYSHHSAEYFERLCIVVERDIIPFICLLHPDILSTRAISPYEDVDMCTEIGEIERFCDSGIPTTDDGYGESFIEVSITCRTVGYSLSIVFHFARSTEFFVLISSSEDDALCLIDISFLSLDLESIFANLRHNFDTILYKCRSSSFGMFLETIHNLSTWS